MLVGSPTRREDDKNWVVLLVPGEKDSFGFSFWCRCGTIYRVPNISNRTRTRTAKSAVRVYPQLVRNGAQCRAPRSRDCVRAQRESFAFNHNLPMLTRSITKTRSASALRGYVVVQSLNNSMGTRHMSFWSDFKDQFKQQYPFYLSRQ